MHRATRSTVVLSSVAATLLWIAGAHADPGRGGTGKPNPGQGSASKAAAAKGQPAPSTQGVVNINTATEDQLQFLPRIGPSKAKAIAKYRGKQKFKSTWDLVHVKGVGRKTYRLLRPFLVVQGETTLAGKAKPEKADKD